jgi:hypothetical protein
VQSEVNALDIARNRERLAIVDLLVAHESAKVLFLNCYHLLQLCSVIFDSYQSLD